MFATGINEGKAKVPQKVDEGLKRVEEMLSARLSSIYAQYA